MARDNRRCFEEEEEEEECGRSGSNSRKNVVIVMDGMIQFTMELLQWTLDNVVTAGCIVNLLGLMPWLNIPLFVKTKSDFWMGELEDTDHVKGQAAIELCTKYGVELKKKVVMGYPLQNQVVHQIMTLHPTWVVFDRHHKRNREFYAKNIPYNILMMNEDGKVDIFKSCRLNIGIREEEEEEDGMNNENCRNCYGSQISISKMRHLEETFRDNITQRCWNVSTRM